MSGAAGRRPPGPKGKPIVGSLPEFGSNALQMFADGWREYGDAVCFRLGPRTIYLFLNPEHLKHILEDQALSYYHPQFFDVRLRAVARHGIISKRKESWVQRRQALEPCFERDRLPSLDEPFVASIEAELDRWDGDGAEVTRNVKDDVYDLGLTMAGRVLLGRDWDRHAASVKPALRVFLEQIDRLLWLPFNVPEWIPLPANRRFVAARRRYDAALTSAIRSTRAEGSDGLLGRVAELEEAHGGRLSDEEVRNEVTHAFMAGWTTTAAALMWTCYLLGRHPEVADTLRAEAADVLGGRAPTSDDMSGMPYNRMVVDEVLRLYPPLWVGARSPLEDDEIGGYHVPADAFVSFCSYLTHRHPDYWTDPESFDPGRWSADRGEPRSPYAYLPFSYGPRSCLGEDVARTGLRLFAPMLVQRYRLRTDEDHPIEHHLGITLSSEQGVKVALSPA